MRQVNDATTNRVPGRRSLLGASAVAFLLRATRRASAAAAVPNAGTAFMGLSRLLTGRTDLDPRTADRLQAALAAAHRDFSAQVTACMAFARAQGLAAAEPLAAALLAQQPSLAPVPHIVVAAWYTGVAGDGPLAVAIAYRDALMFDPVRDVLTAPSYCRAAPGYWTTRPPAV